ncbi:MAG: hypothetical protein JW825_05865 [Candidatus Methanofastidiosa archaeon]|nr:hypothetical protein [Candidatus Methanofastidiosa archaeon]
MNIGKIKSSLVGLAFIAFSVLVLVFYRDDEMAGRAAFSGLLIGIFLLFMRVSYDMPEQISGRIMESTSASLYGVLEGLNIKGKGIFMPPVGPVKDDKVFVPLHREPKSIDLKRIYDKSTFVTDDLSRNFGVFLNSPGGRIIDLMERESGTEFDGMGAELICETLKVLEGLDILSSFDASYDEGEVNISFSHSGLGDSCSRIREDFVGICNMSCCPICSSILSSFARAEKRPLQIVEVERRNKVRIKARYLDI